MTPIKLNAGEVVFVVAAITIVFVTYDSLSHSVAQGARPVSSMGQTQRGQGEEPYPRARWRLARRDHLDHVVLWVSHILVRHRDSEPAEAPLRIPDWKPQPACPNRAPDAARAMAESIRADLEKQPSSFATVARKFSEDVTTKHDGGSLGGMPASQFLLEPRVLDVLAALKFGTASQVVETRFGFHVFRKETPPNDERISARRIVVGYSSATWLQYHERNVAWRSRSREDARLLAEDFADQARRNPEAFLETLAARSDHDDARTGGDIGEWSTREPSAHGKALEKLARLRPGQVTDPIDTPIGFQVFQRTRHEARPRYAFKVRRVGLDKNGKEAARERARRLREELRASPASWKLSHAELWELGRDAHEIGQVLAQLPIDGVARELVEHDHALLILKRVPISQVLPRRPTLFDLPSPARPDLGHVVRTTGKKALVRYVHEISAGLAKRLSLKGSEAEEFSRIHRNLGATFNETEDAADSQLRVEALKRSMESVRRLLGDARYELYIDAVNSQVAAAVIQRTD